VIGRLLLATACALQAGPAFAQEANSARHAALPDWRGVWFLETAVPDINGFPEAAGAVGTSASPYPLFNFADAPFNGEGRSRVAAAAAAMGSRKSPGWGYPMMMSGAAPLQFLITPDETLIINIYRDVRHLYTDGRPLPPPEDRWPTVWGESIAHWEGDTLVVETVSVDEPLKYFIITPPFTANARYVERIRKIGPDRIENVMAIEDPEVLTGPWTARMVYARAEGLDRLIHEAFTNDRSEVENGVFTIEPPSEGD
jgi:hypothetical protein